MPSHTADGVLERLPVHPPASFGLSLIDRACIAQLIGHSLALIEREFILQTLRYNQGNRTRAANILGISIRSLRDRIRSYRDRGESVPEPGSSLLGYPIERGDPDFSSMINELQHDAPIRE
jgi:two-component system, response regulator FlrC